MNDDNWRVPSNIDVNRFPFSWNPYPGDPPYIHQFGTQWHKSGGPQYIVDDATEIKYHDFPKAIALPSTENWTSNYPVDNWDYSWHPDPTDPPYIHKFGTQWQKNGGPTYTVPGASEIKYHEYPVAKVLPHHTGWSSNYSVVDWDYSWHPDEDEPPYIYVWGSEYYSPEVESVIIYTVSGATQYKYMHDRIARTQPLDVVFVSAGEQGEEYRFLTLQALTHGRAKWVRNVEGRENALKKAAEIADTEWFYCFPGKLLANPDFDFNWYPRKSIGNMHYIFYAENPINGLVYGHQAAVCYHRELVLDTSDYGLDFTMSKPHDVMPVVSGVAQYHIEPIVTWRTAFREAIKLRYASDLGDAESEERLKVWLTVGEGSAGELSKLGARHGVEFYDEVGGNPEMLQSSFSWKWLDKRKPF